MGNLILLTCSAICLVGLIWIIQYQSSDNLRTSGTVVNSSSGSNNVSVVSSVSNSTGFTHVSGAGNRIELSGTNNSISLIVSNKSGSVGYMRLAGINIHKVISVPLGQDVSLDVSGNGNIISVDADLKPYLIMTGDKNENHLEFK